MTDQIADLLVRIRNASLVNKREIALPYSKMKEAILAILKNEGFVKDIEVKSEGTQKLIKVFLSPTKKFTHLKQISRPGQRIYSRSKDIPTPIRSLGLVIISTPKGVIAAREAIKMGVGGELICEVW